MTTHSNSTLKTPQIKKKFTFPAKTSMGTQRVILLRFFETGGAKKNKNSEFSHPQHCQNCMHSEDSCMQLKS